MPSKISPQVCSDISILLCIASQDDCLYRQYPAFQTLYFINFIKAGYLSQAEGFKANDVGGVWFVDVHISSKSLNAYG